MKRRFFIRSAAVSAIGAGILPSDLFSNPLAYPTVSVAQWLQQIADAVAARRRSKAVVAPESFARLKESTDNYLAERGYHKRDSTCYFFGAQDACCFYPAMLCHSATGITDLVLPVLRRDADNQWHLVNTLSGFQVEALVLATSALADRSPVALQNLLFPVTPGSLKGKSLAFKTQAGSVSIRTELRNGQAETTCAILEEVGIAYQATFTSKHCLLA